MQPTIPRRCLLALTAVLTIATPALLQGQICAGFPTRSSEMAVAVGVGFPAEATALALEATYNTPLPLSVFAGYAHTAWSAAAAGGTATSFGTFGGGAALELSAILAGMPPGLSLCPVLSLTYASHAGASVLSVPLGVGVGATLYLGESRVRLLPYLLPQLVYQSLSFPAPQAGGAAGSRTETGFGLEAGGLLGYRMLYGGAGVNALFAGGGSEAALMLKLGVTF